MKFKYNSEFIVLNNNNNKNNQFNFNKKKFYK